MPAPSVSWYDMTNTNPVASWAVGTVDAGSPSPDTTFLVWNNRGGASAVSDMTNCTITTKDISGGNTGELVTDKWIEVRVDSMAETTFTAVGGADTRPVSAEGAAGGTIQGGINDGTLIGAKLYYAKLTLHAAVPTLATAGNQTFLTRVAYQYT